MSTEAAAAAALIGEELTEARPLSGGDLSQVVRLRLASGRSAILKVGPAARAEAGMLRAIAAAGVPAPEVLGVADDLLVLSDLGADEGPGDAWGDLGRVLRRLHAARGERYGWSVDHAFGPVPIENAAAPTWPAFWAERRLLPGIGVLPADLARRIEAVAARLPDLLPETPPAALLHGDLWTGNVMATGGRVTGLIDPACYHGDAEVDLAMLRLFGSPGRGFHDGYGALPPGAEARRPVYQLWPAIVHLRLFGAAYRGLVARLLDEIG